MKNSIKLTALLITLSTGLFAATPPKMVVPVNKDVITFLPLAAHRGVEIKVQSTQPGKAIVVISDKDGNVLFKDVMPAYKSMKKGYLLNNLENGDYTIEVTANKQVVKKEVHIYDEERTRVFIMNQ